MSRRVADGTGQFGRVDVVAAKASTQSIAVTAAEFANSMAP